MSFMRMAIEMSRLVKSCNGHPMRVTAMGRLYQTLDVRDHAHQCTRSECGQYHQHSTARGAHPINSQNSHCTRLDYLSLLEKFNTSLSLSVVMTMLITALLDRLLG